MAKQTVSPAERHLEKGVLGVAILALAAVVVKFLVASPNTIDMGAGRALKPGEVYQTMAGDAEQLRDRVRRKQVEPKPVEDWKSELVKLFDPGAPAVNTMVAWGPPVPDMKAIKTEQGNIELVNVLPLGKPIVQVGRSGMELLSPEPVTEVPDDIKAENIDDAYVVPVNWVTVSATFDLDAQRQLAEAKRYLPGQAVPYLVGAELQRREKKWDGSYTEWETIKTYARYELPELPFVEVEMKDGKPEIADEMIKAADKFREAVQEGWWRLQLMRPLPPKIKYGDWWDPPQFEGLDLLHMDDDVMNPPPAEANCPYIDRYPKKDITKVSKGSTEETRVQSMKEDLERRCANIEAWTKQGCYEAALQMVVELLSKPTIDDVRKVDPKKEKWLQDQREKLEPLAEQEKKDKEKGGKPKPPRELLPQQMLWSHDATQNSVMSRKTYQYRMRALLFNTLLAQPMQLKDPQNAAIVLLQGDWSDPSDDVTTPPDTEFFLVSGKEDKKTARVEVFKWHEGDWLRSSFEVGVGDRIGGRASVKIGDETAPSRVEFETAARVVDLRFDFPYRERKERGNKWDFADAKPTMVLVYVDGQGDIQQRVLDEDKRSPRLKELKEMLAKGGAPDKP